VLFAGGLVSIGRIPELRNEQIPGWLDTLDRLRELDIHAVVPGFGPLAKRGDMMRTGAYLRELEASVRRAFTAGLGLTAAMHEAQAVDFRDWKLYAIVQPQNVQRVYLQMEKAVDTPTKGR
jgi:hypothetical protein